MMQNQVAQEKAPEVPVSRTVVITLTAQDHTTTVAAAMEFTPLLQKGDTFNKLENPAIDLAAEILNLITSKVKDPTMKRSAIVIPAPAGIIG